MQLLKSLSIKICGHKKNLKDYTFSFLKKEHFKKKIISKSLTRFEIGPVTYTYTHARYYFLALQWFSLRNQY